MRTTFRIIWSLLTIFVYDLCIEMLSEFDHETKLAQEASEEVMSQLPKSLKKALALGSVPLFLSSTKRNLI
jgi:hypothetical protein